MAPVELITKARERKGVVRRERRRIRIEGAAPSCRAPRESATWAERQRTPEPDPRTTRAVALFPSCRATRRIGECALRRGARADRLASPVQRAIARENRAALDAAALTVGRIGALGATLASEKRIDECRLGAPRVFDSKQPGLCSQLWCRRAGLAKRQEPSATRSRATVRSHATVRIPALREIPAEWR